MTLRLLADDLTGALDTAARFVPLFGPIAVIQPGRRLPDGPCAIDSGTREASAADAVAVLRVLAPLMAEGGIAFKKIDSLLRGNVAAELAACLPFFDHCILAPAFPFQGRRTRGGRQWVRDGESWRDVGADPADLPVALRDAETDADLMRIVDEGRQLAGRVLWCGTAGLAGALTGGAAVPRPRLLGPILALIGSDHPTTRAQVAAARSSAGLCVPDIVPPAGTTRADAKRIIADNLTAILSRAERPGALFVSGGETLRDVCRILGADHVAVDGELEPGVPCSSLIGGAWDGQRIVSKSGAFGDVAFLVRLAGAVA